MILTPQIRFKSLHCIVGYLSLAISTSNVPPHLRQHQANIGFGPLLIWTHCWSFCLPSSSSTSSFSFPPDAAAKMLHLLHLPVFLSCDTTCDASSALGKKYENCGSRSPFIMRSCLSRPHDESAELLLTDRVPHSALQCWEDFLVRWTGTLVETAVTWKQQELVERVQLTYACFGTVS